MNEGKKSDLPAMPFYFGDWRKSPEVRALDLDVRMIWFEMLGLMWESTERGYLTLNDRCVSNSVITRMLGIDITTFEKALKQMEDFNVFSRRDDGAIYSRKMVRDEEIRRIKSEAGKIGMDKRYNKTVITHDITKSITNTENEDENEIEDRITKSLIVTFENFWDLYDKNVGQIKCETLWMQISNEERIECINKLPEYIKSTPDKQYRKDPEKYLKEKAWRNEIIKKDISFKLTPAFEISAEEIKLVKNSLYYGKH